MSTTIPAACITMLGGMRDDDPPLMSLEEDPDVPGGQSPSIWHPLLPFSNPAWMDNPAARVLAVQSEPALTRVLARHLGWDGTRPPVVHIGWTGSMGPCGGSPRWSVGGLTRYGVLSLRDGCSPAFREWLPEHISPDLTRTEAIAEAVVWYARCKRAEEASGYPVDERLLERWNSDHDTMWPMLIETQPLPGVLAEVEKHHGLPTWEVSR